MIGRGDLDAIRARWLAKETDPSDVAAVLFLFDELEERLEHVTRERDEARVLNAEWAKKAATWIASPEAAQRLDGYRDLAQQVAEAQRERDEARADAERLKVERDAALEEVERWNAQHLESQHNGAREAIARKSAEAEVERLKVECDVARARCETLRELADRAAAEQGLAQRRMMEAQAQRDAAGREVKALREACARAYRRGAEAMREACAQWIPHLLCTVDCDPEESMRALPIPEEP